MELFNRRCNVSPLILAFIFITFFHNVLSRHRIRHYKDRFKRQQGAHLYLPGSYITEGGEGPDGGPWTEWSEPSPCSRTCGGGVSSQYRICTEGYSCQGPEKRYFSCNTQDCPDIADFRAQQCSEFNNIPFEGVYYQWVPYTKAPNPCELNCMPKGERFYFRHAPTVTDGTRCNDEKLDVCVNGKCQPVGCDMMLGSHAREDLCRVCGGNGSTCNTIQNTLPMKDMQVGYNDILLIPAGATNIKVEEIGPSNNYLAVRNTSGHYYLNGNWRIDFPRSMEFAGCKFHYDRSPQGFSAPDIITCLGPTDEPLFIVILYQDSDIPVSYTYSLPTNVVSGSESESYAWTFDEFTPCSVTCGGGYQYRNVTCAGRKTLEPVDRSLCNTDNEPESQRKCSEIACEARWIPHIWDDCSAPCGEGGVQTRKITCEKIDGNGYPSLADESECLTQGPKPQTKQKCNVGKICAKWHTDPWKPCDHLCGDGRQTRKITCYLKNEKNKIEVLEDSECEAIEPKPEAEKKCNVRPCEGVDWIASEWTGCDRICGLKNETRKVRCATASGQVHADDLCESEEKPETVRKCEASNATCEYLWYASQWSECSVKCGEGVQTRTLFCGVITAEGVKKVENDKCDPSKNFETIKSCVGEEEECEGEWFSGPWGKCSKPCGGGERTKKVVCLKDNEVVDPTVCGSDKIVFSHEECNTLPCSEDTIMPTDVTQFIDESETVKDATTEISEGTKISETTLESDSTGAFEITTEPASATTKVSEDDEYEIVPDTNCDDGEWVDAEEEPTDSQEEEDKLDATVGVTATETPLSMDDLMLSDGTTATGEDNTLETGSGDFTSSATESSMLTKSTDLSGSTDEEGSGTEPTVIIDTGDTEITVITSEKPESSQLSTEISSDITTEISASSLPGSSEVTSEGVTTSSDLTTGSDVTTDMSASDITTTDSGKSTVSSSLNSDITTASSDLTTLSSESSSGSSDITDTSITVDSTADTKSTDSETSGSTDTSDSTDIPESTITSENTDTTESTDTTETTVSTDNTETTETTGSDTTETTETSLSSDSMETSLTTEASTEDSSSDTSSGDTTVTTDKQEAKVIMESVYGVEEITTHTSAPSETTTEFSSGTSESGFTTESGSTEYFSTVEYTGTTEATTQFSGSTGITTESVDSSIALTGSTTEFTGTTTESSVTASGATDSSETTREYSTTEFAGSTDTIYSTTGLTDTAETSTEQETISTEQASTEETIDFSGSTVSGTTDIDIFSSTSESEESTYGTTSIIDVFTKKPKMCKRRKLKACKKSPYGCCWDNITPAEGPFDKGCKAPKTCKESKYGCCNDGVSAALGPKLAGCPSSHCNETLFGCCPDKKTPAEGNDNEGCPPKCLTSKYGCCNDNITEAKGPKHKGCKEEKKPEKEKDKDKVTQAPVTTEEPELKEDCNNSTYRCCPDGVTTAEGPGFQGCDLPCSNSTFGCCQDGVSPAHGSSGEGCCLSSAFGCCPDNIIPARGEKLEGCGCQYSPYGCCPDNSTTARGYNNEGCGCQYTQYGCCPDNFTPANGPEYQGCLCHTFQFGCCQDGIIAARGPHQQGCGCRNTEFGCCTDEETPASGPNLVGCGCESTKFGCCLDGLTEAKGENFEGCETIPPNLQASCALTKERGTCRNYTVKWFFDMDYGGCSRFWYGGCDGNGNRYKTKEECDQVCVEPQGPERCNLPKVAGPCEGYYPQWHYDKELRQCVQFIYGGCLGNNNRFETREECMGLCVKDSSVDACEQPKEEGPCKGAFQRYYYDKETGECNAFNYGGCKGNNNNFKTLEACNQKCSAPGRKKDHCSLPRAQGNCTERLPRWYYDTPEKRCVPFYYSGCSGNQNNFNDKEACEKDCPMEIVKDTCQLPAETGECANYVDRWYFDTREKVCRQFYYGGCGGNGNNFETQQRCQARCEQGKIDTPQPFSYTERPAQPIPTEGAVEPFRTDMCFLSSDPGPCRSGVVKYYYDQTDGVCKSFTYGGCDGNRNNFNSIEECLQHCGTARDLCTLPPVVGPCNGEYLQYYYQSSNDSCLPFNFGGCGGNYNRFQDQSSCEQRCRKAPPTQATATHAPPAPPSDIAMCNQLADAGNCTEDQVAFFFDKDTGSCSPFTYTGCGGNDNRFNSEEQCERICGSFRGQDVCNMERDPGPCRGYFVKYYYDKLSGHCEQFAFGGCQGNGNRFSSNEECERICVTHIEIKPNTTAICRLPVDQGPCEEGYHKRWYFDDQRGECIAFLYSGCGGNFNNFKSFQSCNDYCRELLPPTRPSETVDVTEMPSHPCQEVFNECTTLRCPYGVEAYIDDNDCNRCQCRDPCRGVECLEDEQCAIDINRNKTSNLDADFIAICRKSNKPGSCPNLEPSETNCEQECRSDADCTLHLKCCSTGCGTACVDPTQQVTQQPEPAYTEGPIHVGVQEPKVDTQVFEPETSGLIGDQVVLRCAVTGNPNPRIKWSKENIEIDGTQPRYRIKLDQSLQIITLHKTDSGIYLCTADNGIGEPITNQIKLDVVDSEPRPATVLDQHDEPPVVVSLNAPTTINCFALGHPFPAVTWWKDDSLIPLKNNEFEVRKDFSLLIHSVKLHNLGIYTCQAYNGIGKAASWAVTVKAKGPYHFTGPDELKYQQYIVNPPEGPVITSTTTTTTPRPPIPPYRPPEPYVPPTSFPEPSNEIVPEHPDAEGAVVPPTYLVPVRANITTNDQRYPVGSEIQIPCEVSGYPDPQVQWYKDSVAIYPSEKIQISDSNTLTILQASKADSGYYQCEATNAYTKASSTLEISIEGMFIHPSCTDNQFFANCALIVKAQYCSHKYYAKFCCRSCTEAGLLPVDGPHLAHNKQNALETNLV